MTTELYKSPVAFDQEAHTYELNGKYLNGVTGIVAWLFPDTYDTIPDHVLQKAAERGHRIHKAIELLESMGIELDDIPELMKYKALKYENNLSVLKTEYLVSDEENIASSIDLVFTDYELCDIKGTSSVHKKNLMAQLSIYAYLFERSNPGVTVPRLSCIWLPREQYGKQAYIPIPRIPSEDCKRIIEEYVNGGDPSQFAYLFEETLPAALNVSDELIAEMGNQIKLYKQAETQYKAIKASIEKLMKDHNVTKWETDHFKASLGQESISTKFDVESFKEDYPDLYSQYLIQTKRKGTFRLN